MTSGGSSRSSEIIDFTLERSRHEHFFGREDALAELDRLVEKKPAGFVLVLGGPGMGKSALLSRWLELREKRGEPTPHHFLRRGVNRWDEPDVVRENLAARIEALYPAQRDEGAPPERRLDELLVRVSEQALAPGGNLPPAGKRLILLLDGLDEAVVRDERDNPIDRILPYWMPRGVIVLCALRPKYPHLAWLERREQMVHPPLDLAQPGWASSNRDAVASYWAFAREQFSPPLSQALIDAALQAAQGNLLYSLKLSEQLENLPLEERQDPSIVVRLPRGLEAPLEELWGQLQAPPREASEFVRQGLGLLAVAREALPAYAIEAALKWFPGSADERLLCTPARQVIVKEPADRQGKREPRYRLYHESFGELVQAKMAGALPDMHGCLVEHVAAWPPAHASAPFLRTYALRHGIVHRAEAAHDEADWQALERLCLDMGYLRDAAKEAGSMALEVAVTQAAEHRPVESVVRTLTDLSRALIKESHWLRGDPDALPGLMWNQLLCLGWSTEHLRKKAQWPPRSLWYGLRRPLERIERSQHAIPDAIPVYELSSDGRRLVSCSNDGTLRVCDLDGDQVRLRFEEYETEVQCCALSADGRRLVSGSRDCTLRVWDLDGERELLRFEGHESQITCCTLSADGRRLASSWDTHTLRVWDVDDRRELARTERHEGEVTCCALSADGRHLVSGSRDRSLRVWDADSGHELVRLEGHEDEVTCCALSVDSRRLVSGSRDGTLRVWDLESGRELLRLGRHEDRVTCCALSADGRRLVSSSADRTLRVWDLETGQLETTVYGAHGFLRVAISIGGIIAGDGSSNIWFLTELSIRRDLRADRAPQPQPRREPPTLRFLHLTDWHAGVAEQGWLWPNVREAFFDDLERLHERLGGVDAVFFTGDLTQRGSAAEFAKLEEGLAEIWRRLAELGSAPVLVAVPGNHDLVRPPAKAPVVKALGHWHADADIRGEFWSEPEGEYRRCVRSAFAPYAAWAERQSAMKRAEPRRGTLPGDVATVLERGGLRVGVVGLNSAFLQLTGDDFEKKLDLDVRQVHAACGGDAPSWLAENDLNLLLTHHPPAWLEPARLKGHFQTEIAPPGRFALHLHGHLHEPGAHAGAVGGSRPRHRLAGPSLFGLERFERPGGAAEVRIRGYAAGRIELVEGEGLAAGKTVTRVRLWPRRLVTKASGSRVMERDPDFELDDDDSLAFDVQCKRRTRAAPATPPSSTAVCISASVPSEILPQSCASKA